MRQSAVSRTRTGAVYAAILLGGILAFLAIRRYGETLTPPAAAVGVPGGSGAVPQLSSDVFLHVLLALAAVVVVGRLLARAFRAIGQPPVIGEVIGGILLGPSLLGRVAPDAYGYILPPSIAPYLSVLAQVGVVLYMFLVGLELNVEPLRRRAHAAIMTSHASIVVPFVLGSLLALYLYPFLSPAGVPFTSFALFMGVAMSITAFPVLARILSDRGMTRSELGVIALTCAAVDDVTAWCLLAFVVGVVQARMEGAFLVAVLTLGFIAVMFLVVRPLAARAVDRLADRQTDREAVALALVGLLLSALVSERIGVHAIFGAFLFGAVLPHDTALARSLKERMEDLVTVLLLPAFFAFTGMRTEIGLVSGFDEWLICGLIILVATAGKFGGTLAAARFTGLPWRQATGLGILMNTRGLMELVVLNIGLDLGVISPTLFTMMVLMALVTTIATTPVLESLGLGRACER
ncbi:MAG TPA: cation:proton antiporter [Vicinamibacterales bacterium]|nr:cation:proton antiporter [Vicinamibacterales bacterium]